MQLYIHIYGNWLLALIDTGLTHNFKQESCATLAWLLQLPTSTLGLYQKKNSALGVANGDHVSCEGVTYDVALHIGHEDFSISHFSIDLSGFDIIYDITYLPTLGTTLWDLQGPLHGVLKGCPPRPSKREWAPPR
jgi:hypothetical protein